MAADPTLVNVAYKVATGGTTAAGFGKWGSFGKFLGQTLSAASKYAVNHVKTRAKEFENVAKEVMNKATDELSDDDWNMRYGQVDSMKRDYILGNRRTRAEIMRDLRSLGAEQVEHDGTKADIVVGTLNPGGINKNYMGTNQGLGLQGILNGNTPISYHPETGEPGYMLSNNNDIENFETAKDYFLASHDLSTDALEKHGFDLYSKGPLGEKARQRIIDYYSAAMLTAEEGGKTAVELNEMFGEKWYSRGEIQNIIKEQSVDLESRKLILQKAKADYTTSKNLTSGSGAFPYQAAYDDTRDSIIGLDTANKRSIGRDEIIPGSGRTWYTDMQEAMATHTYEDFGIPLTKEEVDAMDPTKGDGKITPSDSRRIIRSIMNDEELYDDFLASYITKFRQQNWNKGAIERANWVAPETTNDDTQPITEDVVTQEDPPPVIELTNGDKKVWDATTQKYIYVPKEHEIDKSNIQNFKPSYKRTSGGNLYDNRPIGYGSMK